MKSGRWALTASGVGVALMTIVGLLGPSAAEPPLGRSFDARPSPFVVTGLLWAAVACGLVAVLAGLSALRAGWRPRPGLLVVLGVVAVAVLAALPPLGSTDMLDYATYGRIMTLGHSPYTMTPYALRRLGDPIALLAPPSWRGSVTVYGPVGTAVQALASWLGGSSAVWTIFWLKVENAAAFLATAYLLDRMAGPDPARRLRVHVLWTINPLMLWAVVGGGHIDGVAVALAIAGLFVVRRAPVAGGFLVGLAAAVKASFALVAVGALRASWRSPRALAGLIAGGLLGLVPGYLLIGHRALDVLLQRGNHPSTMSLWTWIPEFGLGHPPGWLQTAGSLIMLVVLAAIFARGFPDEPVHASGVRLALVFGVAWLICSPVYYPWYEVMIFPLLALMAPSRLDGLLVIRSAIGAVGVLPGVDQHYRPSWLRHLGYQQVPIYVLKPAMLVIAVMLVIMSIRRSWGADQVESHVMDLSGDRSPAGSARSTA